LRSRVIVVRRGIPDWNGIDPTTFSVASSMIQNCYGYEPMMSVPLPALTRGFSPLDWAERTESVAAIAIVAARTVRSARRSGKRLVMVVTGK